MTGLPDGADAGFGLPSVLLLITLLSLLVASVLAVDLAGRRLSARRSDQLQAQYAAEAALERALVEGSAPWLTPVFEVDLGDRVQSRARAEPFGPLTLVTADGQSGRSRFRIRALAGLSPGTSPQDAVVLGDRSTPLILAGDASVFGPVRTGPAGLQFGTIPTHPGLPHHEGTIETSDTPPPRVSLPAALACRRVVESALAGSPIGPATPDDSTLVLTSSGDLVLHAADLDSAGHRDVWVIAQGDLTVIGPLTLPPFSRLVAGGTVRLVGPLDGGPALAYGRQSAETTGSVTAAVHLLAGQAVRVGAGGALRYPSSAVALSSAGATVEIESGAALDGFAAYAPETLGDGVVTVRQGAMLRGGLYSADRADVEGEVRGPTVAWQFRFYESPATYVNWLRAGRYDARSAPPPAVPFGVGAPGPTVVVDADRTPMPDAPEPRRRGAGLYDDRGGRLPGAPRRRPSSAGGRLLLGRRPRRRAGPRRGTGARSVPRGGRPLSITAPLSSRPGGLARGLPNGAGRPAPRDTHPGVEGLWLCALVAARPEGRSPDIPSARRPSRGSADRLRSTEAGFTLVELSVGTSLALLVVALALAVFGVLGRQAAAWRANTELSSTAASVLTAVSSDLMRASAPPLQRAGAFVWTVDTAPGTTAVPRVVTYRLAGGILSRDGRPMHSPTLVTESFEVSARHETCVGVSLRLSTATRTPRRFEGATTACSRALPLWPAPPIP